MTSGVKENLMDMKKVLTLFMLTATLSASAQQVLTLERCRELALANNKQLGVARVKQEMAANTRKAVRTKYLPKVDAVAGYEFFSREISLLNNDQKTTLANLGTTAVTGLSGNISTVVTALVQQGMISPEMAQKIGDMVNLFGPQAAQMGNQLGQSRHV